MSSLRRHPLLLSCALALIPGRAWASVVTDWNLLGQQQLQAAGAGVPQATRALAIAQLAAFEAVNATSHEFEAFGSTLPSAPAGSAEAAAAGALHTAFAALVPQSQAIFDQQLQKSLAQLEKGASTDAGVQLGVAAAQAVLALRNGDGSEAVTSYAGSLEPGKWRPTPRTVGNMPAEPLAALAPEWRVLSPFSLQKPQQFRPTAPPAITSDAFTVDYLYVKGNGAFRSLTRDSDQTELAAFWSQAPQVAFNLLAGLLATREELSLTAETRLFALLNVALADTIVAAWDAKYRYGFWRPVSAIRSSDDYGNPNAVANLTWSPLVETPAVPGYPNELSACGSAAFAVLTDVFGRDDVSFALESSAAIRVRGFESFSAAKAELLDSIAYSGADFRFSAEAGRALGEQVGDYVVTHLLRAPGASAGGADAGGAAASSAGQAAEPAGGSPGLDGEAGASPVDDSPAGAGGAPASSAGASPASSPPRAKTSGCALVAGNTDSPAEPTLPSLFALGAALLSARSARRAAGYRRKS